MKIAIIGQGAIAQYVRKHVTAEAITEVAQIVRKGKERAGDVPYVSDLSDLPEVPDLIVDCAGHGALVQHVPKALAQGIDVLTVSLGALADAALATELEQAAIRGSARLHLASGAIGGLDVLRAARVEGLAEVTYTGRKPPKGWVGSPAEDVLDLPSLTTPATHFDGTARDAALRYPKNANVAAAVALAGLGFDRTRVTLIADPQISTNVHQITAKGAFGSFDITIFGNSLPDNPRSSALAAMSVVADLAGRKRPIGF
ncbi:aspartate dehydrogenase [Cognatiyoonia sp. IB215182]|uniref:aspartate dehydrogenase n=1 Tax=Cognatiyoonia sp. IB215182 TaxID=3097353 RepID=UPI002A117675|nr:aspartate dehydrogenase [Cognatiyoonia sp. IB215182]MDX8350744.1 aspartate dehydrogenase [Cognatiyoonia sp. IB215182]